jgi:hypothetical protein
MYRLSHHPGEPREQGPREYGVRIGKEVQVNGVGSRAKMLDAEVGEDDPEELDQLNRYE